MPRYLGNSKAMEVHDTLHERASCKISDVKAWHRVVFYPDTLEEAQKLGFDGCAYCILYPST